MTKIDLNKKLKGLNASLTQAKKDLKAAKTDTKKQGAEKAIDNINEQIEATKAELQKANALNKAEKAQVELLIMDKQKVDKLWVNPKGEYFTSSNFAELSVKDKKQVKELTREVVESQIK